MDSQEAATGPYPELNESSPHLPAILFYEPSSFILPSIHRSSRGSLPFISLAIIFCALLYVVCS